MMMNSSNYINQISKEYSLYVLYNRAIPLVTDGLKMSQRIALWLMYNKPNKEIKTMQLAGDMIGSNLYVHGDKAASDTIGKLAAPYCNNVCLMEGIGQFGGKVDPQAIGAPRYTYVKRTKFAEEVLWKDMDILPMVENYDGSVHMPMTFLPIIPTVLLNGIKGIAIGYATNILPRSLESIVEATIEAIDTGKVTHPLVPSFHGFDLSVEDLTEGKFLVSGKLHVVNTSTVKITELPPDMSIDKFKQNLIDLEEANKIVDFIDNSSDSIDIDVKMRRVNLSEMTEADLFEMFKLYSVLTENLVVLDWEGEKVYKYENPQNVIRDFVIWRLKWYEKRYQKWLEDEHKLSMYLLSYMACFMGTEKLGSIQVQAQKLNGKREVMDAMGKILEENELPVDEDVLDRLSNLSLYRWSLEGYQDAETKLNDCLLRIEEYESILADENKRKKIFKKEVKDLLKVKWN